LVLGGLGAAGCDPGSPEIRTRADLAATAGWRAGSRRLDRLRSGEAQTFPLSLQKDQYLHLVVDQLGVDVAVTAADPAGHLLFRVDSPNDRIGPEDVFLVAGSTGRYTVTVKARQDPSEGGRFVLRIAALRPATPEDRRRAEAAGAYSRARLLAADDPGSPQAAALYRRSADLWAGLSEESREAWALYRLGLLEAADPARRREGAETLARALDLFQRAGEKKRQALGLADLGNTWLQLGELENAERVFKQAAALWAELGAADEQAARWSDLALTRSRRGQIHAALDLYLRTAAAWEKLGKWHSLAITCANLGSLYASLGESRLAQDQYHRALALLERQPDPGRRAVVLNKLGDVLLRTEGPEAALKPFREALQLRRQQRNARGLAVTLNSLGQAHLEAEDPRRTLRMFAAALTIFQEQRETLSVASVLNNQGLAYERLSQTAQAQQLYQQALALAVREGPRLPAEETALFGLARIARREGRLAEAERLMEQTLNAVEEIRGQLWRQDLRSSYQDSQQDKYAFLIDLLAERRRREPQAGHDARAFAVAERARARSLLDLLSTARRRPPPEELRRLDELSRRINEQHREQLAVASEAVEDRMANLITDLRQTEAEITGSHLALRPAPPTLSLQQTQSLLDRDTLLLEYFLGEERSFLWAVTPSTVRFVADLPGRHEIEDAARQTYQRLTESHQQTGETAARQTAARLSRMLLAPVVDLLGRRRLVVVAPGALQLIPFAALPDPGSLATEPRPLIVDHEIVSLPSASVLGALRTRAHRPPPDGLLAVLADPVTAPDDERLRFPHTARPTLPPPPNLARLPFAGREAAAILSLTDGERIFAAFGFDAGRNVVQGGRLRDYRILHFATHGLFNDTYPELSALALSAFDPAGHPIDGHLRAYEIPALDLRADLVVLSACRTALGNANGEGFASLTHGFFHAGVPRLVVSLWDVDDRATGELMQRFYAALLKRRLPPAQALRQAQLSLLGEERWRAPYYWAGFTFEGDWY
jgi:CHAT domain-containing protein/Tfp pilus assembly protein PilF